MPAKAGIQTDGSLDSRFRGDDILGPDFAAMELFLVRCVSPEHHRTEVAIVNPYWGECQGRSLAIL